MTYEDIARAIDEERLPTFKDLHIFIKGHYEYIQGKKAIDVLAGLKEAIKGTSKGSEERIQAIAATLPAYYVPSKQKKTTPVSVSSQESTSYEVPNDATPYERFAIFALNTPFDEFTFEMEMENQSLEFRKMKKMTQVKTALNKGLKLKDSDTIVQINTVAIALEKVIKPK